jgi:ADP-ribose pyrophosphatase
VTFRKVGEREVFRGNARVAPITAGVGTFESSDGHRFERDIVHHPGAVSIVPLMDDGRVVLVRQYRAPVDREVLEIPAGKRDVDGEEPALTARRELVEEVGLEAARIELLVEFFNSPGFCDEYSFTYLATGLTGVERAPVGHEEEAMQIEYVPLDDVPALIAAGELVDAKTIIGLLVARERL